MSALSSFVLVVVAASPRVAEVVVFPDRAQVTRVATATCQSGAGSASVAFEGIPPAADPSSFRASARGGTVQGLRAETRTREHAYSKELAAFDEERRKVETEIASVDDTISRAQNLAELGNQYDNVARERVSREMAVGRADTRAWTAAFDAAMQARLSGADQSVNASTRRRALEYRLQDLSRRASGLQAAAQRTEHVAEVLVSCAGSASSPEVRLTYLVGGASWHPTYEARASEGGAKGHVELSTFAAVRQATGEDWAGAKLTLSTAVPVQDATPPELKKLEISAEKREQPKKVLARREEQIRHAQSGQGVSGGEGTGLAARSQGLSVQLEVPGASDVKGDGSTVRLFVARSRLPARFAWRTAPSLSPFVFRVAEVTNTAAFPLLTGSLDAFRRNGFIGRYPLERVPQGGAFELTFGLEDSMKVKRIPLEEVKRDAGLFNQHKRFRYAYRIEVANHGRAPEEVELVERIPVSELEDVVVEVEQDKTTSGYELKLPDGLVVWKVKLKPAEERKIELAFHVDVPASYDTGGL